MRKLWNIIFKRILQLINHVHTSDLLPRVKMLRAFRSIIWISRRKTKATLKKHTNTEILLLAGTKMAILSFPISQSISSPTLSPRRRLIASDPVRINCSGNNRCQMHFPKKNYIQTFRFSNLYRNIYMCMCVCVAKL